MQKTSKNGSKRVPHWRLSVQTGAICTYLTISYKSISALAQNCWPNQIKQSNIEIFLMALLDSNSYWLQLHFYLDRQIILMNVHKNSLMLAIVPSSCLIFRNWYKSVRRKSCVPHKNSRYIRLVHCLVTICNVINQNGIVTIKWLVVGWLIAFNRYSNRNKRHIHIAVVVVVVLALSLECRCCCFARQQVWFVPIFECIFVCIGGKMVWTPWCIQIAEQNDIYLALLAILVGYAVSATMHRPYLGVFVDFHTFTTHLYSHRLI